MPGPSSASLGSASRVDVPSAMQIARRLDRLEHQQQQQVLGSGDGGVIARAASSMNNSLSNDSLSKNFAIMGTPSQELLVASFVSATNAAYNKQRAPALAPVFDTANNKGSRGPSSAGISTAVVHSPDGVNTLRTAPSPPRSSSSPSSGAVRSPVVNPKARPGGFSPVGGSSSKDDASPSPCSSQLLVSLRRTGNASSSTASPSGKARSQPSIPSKWDEMFAAPQAPKSPKGFGNGSSRFYTKPSENPGPGYYDSGTAKSHFIKESPSLSRKGFTQGFTARQKRLPEGARPSTGNIGPGQYHGATEPFSRLKDSARDRYAFPRHTESKSLLHDQPRPQPGPYNLDMEPGAMSRTKRQGSAGFVSSSKRSEHLTDTREIPPPGSYDVSAAMAAAVDATRTTMWSASRTHRFEQEPGPHSEGLGGASAAAAVLSRPGSPSAMMPGASRPTSPSATRGGFTYAEATPNAGASFHYYGNSDPTIRRAVSASPGGAALRRKRSGYDNGVPTPAHYYDPERDALEEFHRQVSSGRLVGRSYTPLNVSSSLKHPTVNIDACRGSFGFNVHGNRFKGEPPLNDAPGPGAYDIVRDEAPNRPSTAAALLPGSPGSHRAATASPSATTRNAAAAAPMSPIARTVGSAGATLRMPVDDETWRRLGPQFRSGSPQRGEVIKPAQDRPPGPAYYNPSQLTKPAHLNLDQHWA